MEKTIPIVFACDNKIVDLCSVSIASIIANASEKYKYEIYILYTCLEQKKIESLEAMSIQNINVSCINIEKHVNFKILYKTEKYPYEMYYRYYAPLILQYDKIIYLDCDTIAVNDVANLYNENLDGYPIGMVRDFDCYIHHSNMDFNSGVMLIDAKLFEKLKIREKCIKVLKENTKYKFPDQTALNIVSRDNVKELYPQYNHQVSLAYYHKFKEEIRKRKFRKLFLDKPEIIHFSYITKPYKNIYSIYNKQFWQYAKNSPYYMELVSKYLEDPYKVLKNSPIEDIYIDMAKEGKIGLKKIFEVLIYQIKYWFIYKINEGEENE